MIKYNANTINAWNYDTSSIVKVYRNNAIVFYKVSGESPTPEYKVCFAVVDDISQYQETEFEDVFDKATDKWYKLNNINQYEEYGVYGSGRGITYYKGKLTIDEGYEYEWNGSSWVNLGEVTGSTATLPNVPFTVNYNAKNYDANTKTLAKTSGQLADVDAVITAGTPTVHDGYLTIASNTRATISGYSTYFNRDSSNPNMTIVSKQRTDGNNCHMFANRDSSYNWMYRCYNNKLTLHGGSETGQIAVTTQPVIESVRVNSTSPMLTYNNYTDGTSSTTASFSYGSKNSEKFAMFQGYGTTNGENFVGDFYWIYMSQTTLTDEQIQEVIDYNEGSTTSEYPKYYSEKSEPLDSLTFNTLAEAQTYAYNNCVYDGMRAMIDGAKYYFDSTDENGWVENESRLPQGYTEVEYIERNSTHNGYLPLGEYFTENTVIDIDFKMTQAKGNAIIGDYGSNDNDDWRVFLNYDVSVNNWLVYDFIDSRNHYDTGDWSKRFYLEIGNYYIKDLNTDTYLVNATRKTSFTRPNQMYLFHMEGNQNTNNIDYGYIYSVKIYQNNELVRDFVPCIRDNDSMVGMYDLVNDAFYYPPNNGTMVAGPQV